MNKVLNLDLDFFVSPIAQYRSDDDERLSDTEYDVWVEDDVREFLQNQCGLLHSSVTPARIIDHHKEAFFLWREMMQKGQLSNPFQLWHVDAHDDLGGGMGDLGFLEVITEVVFQEVPARSRNDLSKLTSGNYLLYALACRWISSLTLVRHPEDNESIPKNILSHEQEFIEIKGQNKQNTVVYCEPKINFEELELEDFSNTGGFDFVIVSRSPSFTPQKADDLINVIQEYIRT